MRTITRALVEQEGQGRMIAEQALARDELLRRALPVDTFLLKDLQRRRVLLAPDALVVGTIPAVRLALRHLGVEAPAPLDYPDALRPWLRRAVTATTVRELSRAMRDGSIAATFVKPREQQKRFTGFVAIDRGALGHVEALGQATPVWCSEVVTWRSEQRVFVLDGAIVGVCTYSDCDEPVDLAVVREAIGAWRAAGDMPRACAMDFGVLDDGQTALVEVNDAFGVGAYGLDAAPYVDLLAARWEELTRRL